MTASARTAPSGPRRVVVIGAGVAGLATAALLARDGADVLVLEQRHEIGGRAGSWSAGGFRFDTGPSWYLMPEVFEHTFRLLGTTAADELDLVRLDPAYRVLFETHATPLDVRSGTEAACATFEDLEPGAGARLARYLESARETYDLARGSFLYTTFRSPRRLLGPDVLRRLGRLPGLLLTPLDRFVSRRFADPRLRQVLGYPAVFLGTSPDRAPSMYHLMSHLDLADGVLYPRGGLVTVVEALARLADGHGARVRTGCRVTAVRTTGRGRATRVTGVTFTDADGVQHEAEADVVVGAGDLHDLETRILPPHQRTYPEAWWADRDPGPGAVLVCLGIRGRVPQLAHHTLLFTADWDAGFRAIRTGGPLPDPTSLYVCAPSRTDPTVAPPDAENLFLLVPVPADVSLGGGGVDGAGDPGVERVADAAIAQVAAWAGVPDLADRVVVRRTVGPADFARDLAAWSGGALGPAHTLRQSAMFRAGNASTKVAGLLYAGASTIPGIGLPMCLISAELVLKRLRGDTSAGPLPEPLPDRTRAARAVR